MSNWQPSASVQVLQARSGLLSAVRAYFSQQNVIEVTTPALSQAANTDPNIESLAVSSTLNKKPYWLHTSPEFFMKRLLANGVGDCYQICQVYRDGEVGHNHNPEFTLLEWYRLGFSMMDLVAEVEELITRLSFKTLHCVRTSYCDVFESYLNIHPIEASTDMINQALIHRQIRDASQASLSRHEALDLLFSQCIATKFPATQLTTVYHYPADQASLARIDDGNPKLAERFECFWGETELANGFHELSDAKEQKSRFIKDNEQRLESGLESMPIDQRFIQSLEKGEFPDCSGVALGVDRLLMKLLNKTHIRDVLSFDWLNN